MRFIKLLVLLSILLPALNALSQESPQGKDKSEIDFSELKKEIEKVAAKPYSLGGFLEFQPTLLGLDKSSAIYRARYFDDNQVSPFPQYSFRLRSEGSYKKSIFSAFFRADTHVRNEFDGWDEDTKLFEGFASVKPVPGFTLEAGKRVAKWGKGYAWNPASFVDRPKNPEDPTEALEGFTLISADLIRSFTGPLKTAALSTIALPVYEHVNSNFGKLNAVNFASKLYFLLYDTDIDFMVLTGSSRTSRFGYDFSRNVTTNFEVHGEFGFINNQKLKVMDRQGAISTREFDAISYVLGLRYLTEQETTYIIEYYRNGAGYTRREMRNYFAFVNDSYKTYVDTGDDSGLVKADQLLNGAYGMPNPGQHYLYFRASQKEPFDILYFTPAFTSIINLTDASLTIIPELVYSPVTNLEVRFRTAVQLGKDLTDYGEKQNNYRVELRLRYYFGI